ncbi:MAG: CHAT domain-containing protein [Acidobacteriota bacterium]
MAAIEETLENEPHNRRAAFISWRLLAVILALIVVLIVAIVIAYKARGSDVERGTAELVEAFSKRRLFEPRLSGGFKGGEFRPSVGDASDIKSSEVERARDLITNAAAKGEPRSQLAYARLLLLSEAEKLPEALKCLRRAVASEPDSDEAHNDLGVCLIQQGKLEDAIEEFDAALRHRTDMPEALFNRALCYERLLLRDAAAVEYGRFVEVEHDSGWQDEGRRRLQEVSSPLAPQKREADIIAAFDAQIAAKSIEEAKRFADHNLQVMIKHASERLPREYLKDLVEGRLQQAQQALFLIELIGERLAEAKQDASIADLGRYLRNLPEAEWRAELRLISDYTEAGKLAYQSPSAAQNSFDLLRREFATRGNIVFEYFSIHYLASCHYSASQLASAVAASKEALNIAQKHTWPYRQAQELMLLGILYSRLGQDSLAIKSVDQARLPVRGMPIEAYAFQYLSDAYNNLGDIDKGLSCLRESTKRFLESMPTRKEVASNYLNIGDLYRRRGDHGLASLYARQSLSVSELVNDNKRAAQASAFIAVEHSRLNQVDPAEAELNRAFDYLSKVDAKERDYTESVVLTLAGEMARKIGDASRSLEFYSRAEAIIERSEGKEIPLLEVLRGRAKTYVEAGEFSKARADLERAVTLLERYRTNIVERDNRSRFLDARQGVFDELVALSLDALGRREQAFDFSEASRARTLLDESAPVKGARSASGRTATPLKLQQIQAELPGDLRLVTYSVTDERTYIFTITRSRFDVVESFATTEIIDRLVQEYVSGLKSRSSLDELSGKAKQLYEYLIEPIGAQLSDGKRLCIVPDKALHFLPFAALIDRSDQFLVKHYNVTYAPSATVLAHCIEERRLKGTSGNERALAVGNPKFDRERFPTLETLTDADLEAAEIAKFYPGSVFLNSASASKKRVKEALNVEIVHLAVHVLVDEKSPWLAALVLAGDGSASQGSRGGDGSGDEGLLYLNEIYGISLPRTRLVVLSACQSALGQYYRGEGIVSLVRPFLALQVPMVVASLWSIDSEATAPLMIEFHKNRTSGSMDVGDALRHAQIKLAEDERFQHPFYWAPFIAIGSDN